MKRRIAACVEIFERIKAVRVDAGLKSFKEIPTERFKIEELPACALVYGTDSIIKRSSRTASASRKGLGNTKSLEVVLEIIAQKGTSLPIFQKVRSAVLDDIYPVKNDEGDIDPTTFMIEERTEGPIGYGLPGIEAMIFIINLTYLDE